MDVDSNGLIPAFIDRPVKTANLSDNSAATDGDVAGMGHDAVTAPRPERGSQDYMPQGVSSTGYQRAICGRFLADQAGGLTEYERQRKSTMPPAGNLQHPKQQAWLASPSERSTLEPREADRAARVWREERARRNELETRLQKVKVAKGPAWCD